MAGNNGNHLERVAAFKAARFAILENLSLVGVDLIAAITALTEAFTLDLASTVELGPGWALVATGGTGRGELCPGSDIDLLLLHPKKTSEDEVRRRAEALWYGFWDAGLQLTPGVHTVESAVALGEKEVLSAASWLDARHLVGDPDATLRLKDASATSWRKVAAKQLLRLFDLTAERHAKAGDVAFLLDPDLRDGEGGLRDLVVLNLLAASGLDDRGLLLERQPSDLNAERDVLLAARAELHRVTKRAHDILALQEQDAVASRLGFGHPDDMMAVVSASARVISWCTTESTRRARTLVSKPRASRFGRALKLSSDIALQAGEITITEDARPADDPTLLLRLAANAALNGFPIERATLGRLVDEAPPIPEPWPDRARNALVALLGAGDAALPVIEALDHYGLMVRILPEWATVRSKPQRNAYHRFTVDRHLVEAAINASSLVRSVTRPDLLLVGTWLHDIGKGYPGDHTDVGVELLNTIGPRMGFNEADVATLVLLVKHHLLIPEVATRRDLSDPLVIEKVAAQVGDVETLHLLRALTEADSLATGPTAWSPWKGQLCDQLVSRVEVALSGSRHPETQAPISPAAEQLVAAVRGGSHLAISAEPDPAAPELTVVTIAALDRSGLFGAVTGALAVNGVDVLGAVASTTDDGIALDVLRVTRRLGGETDWRKVERMIGRSLDGSLDLRGELAKRVRTYQSRKFVAVAAAQILVDDEIEERATVVEVRAADGIALLYRVTDTLTRLGLDITSAKVTTLGHEVVDSFSVRRTLPDGGRAKQSPLGPSNDEIRQALLKELTETEW
jgi:[protein-PII] uridylyltransferase